MLIKSPSYRGTASKIYDLLQGQLSDPLLKVKSQWALDTSVDISPEDWESHLRNMNTTYKEVGNRFIHLKIHRWHRNPQQVFKWTRVEDVIRAVLLF